MRCVAGGVVHGLHETSRREVARCAAHTGCALGFADGAHRRQRARCVVAAFGHASVAALGFATAADRQLVGTVPAAVAGAEFCFVGACLNV